MVGCNSVWVLQCLGAPVSGCSGVWVQRCLGAAVFGCSGVRVQRCSGAAVFGCFSVNGGLGSQLALWGLVVMNPDYDRTSAGSYQEPEIVRSPHVLKALLLRVGDDIEALPLLAKKLLLVFRGGVTWGGAQLEVRVDGTPVFWEHTHVSTGRAWDLADMAKSALRAIRSHLDTKDRSATQHWRYTMRNGALSVLRASQEH